MGSRRVGHGLATFTYDPYLLEVSRRPDFDIHLSSWFLSLCTFTEIPLESALNAFFFFLKNENYCGFLLGDGERTYVDKETEQLHKEFLAQAPLPLYPLISPPWEPHDLSAHSGKEPASQGGPAGLVDCARQGSHPWAGGLSGSDVCNGAEGALGLGEKVLFFYRACPSFLFRPCGADVKVGSMLGHCGEE